MNDDEKKYTKEELIRIMESDNNTKEYAEYALEQNQKESDEIQKANKGISEINAKKEESFLQLSENTTEIANQQREEIEQLKTLKDIFSVEMDRDGIEKQISDLLQKEIDSKHPVINYVLDKGGDAVITGASGLAPLIFDVIKKLLESMGLI